MKRLLLGFLALAVLCAAPKGKDKDNDKPDKEPTHWKRGTLDALTEGPTSDQATVIVVGPGASYPNGGPPFQLFTIRGDDLTYTAYRWIGLRRKRPVVTVWGSIRYAYENDKFWILDEKSQYYQLKLLEKRLTTR